jgi:heme exporter protein C
LHQPSTRFTATLDPVFRTPLLVMALGFTLMMIAMHMKAMRNEILRRRIKALTLRTVERAGQSAVASGAAG